MIRLDDIDHQRKIGLRCPGWMRNIFVSAFGVLFDVSRLSSNEEEEFDRSRRREENRLMEFKFEVKSAILIEFSTTKSPQV